MFTVNYSGAPQIAKNAPWDGGFSFATDKNGNPWVGVSCEGLGASVWWPNKDHLSDEPDSMMINAIVPADLMCVANGNLIEKGNAEKSHQIFMESELSDKQLQCNAQYWQIRPFW